MSKAVPSRGLCLGDYAIEALIRKNVTFETYSARHRATRERVEIRCAPVRQTDESPRDAGELLRIVERLCGVENEWLPTVFGGGIDDGVLWMASEFVDGVPLCDRRGELVPHSILEAMADALVIAEALLAAAAVGVFHGDLRPESILVTKRTPKVMDVGCVQLFGLDRETALASPLYRAPEVLFCEGRTGPVDVRSDIYSLGIILYELIARRQAFAAGDGSGRDLLEQIKEVEPRPLTEVARCPELMWRVVKQAIMKSPGSRFQSWRQVISVLGGLLLLLRQDAQALRDDEDHQRRRRARLAAEAYYVAAHPADGACSGFQRMEGRTENGAPPEGGESGAEGTPNGECPAEALSGRGGDVIQLVQSRIGMKRGRALDRVASSDSKEIDDGDAGAVKYAATEVAIISRPTPSALPGSRPDSGGAPDVMVAADRDARAAAITVEPGAADVAARVSAEAGSLDAGAPKDAGAPEADVPVSLAVDDTADEPGTPPPLARRASVQAIECIPLGCLLFVSIYRGILSVPESAHVPIVQSIEGPRFVKSASTISPIGRAGAASHEDVEEPSAPPPTLPSRLLLPGNLRDDVLPTEYASESTQASSPVWLPRRPAAAVVAALVAAAAAALTPAFISRSPLEGVNRPAIAALGTGSFIRASTEDDRGTAEASLARIGVAEERAIRATHSARTRPHTEATRGSEPSGAGSEEKPVRIPAAYWEP